MTLMLHRPLSEANQPNEVWVQLFKAGTMEPLMEEDYFLRLRELYNQRNPHAMVGEFEDDEVEFEEVEPDDERPLDD